MMVELLSRCDNPMAWLTDLGYISVDSPEENDRLVTNICNYKGSSLINCGCIPPVCATQVLSMKDANYRTIWPPHCWAMRMLAPVVRTRTADPSTNYAVFVYRHRASVVTSEFLKSNGGVVDESDHILAANSLDS